MRPPLILCLLLLAFPLASTGCSDDCTRLADQTCARVGETHEECERIRQRASNASQDDKRACGKALAVTDLLTPKS